MNKMKFRLLTVIFVFFVASISAKKGFNYADSFTNKNNSSLSFTENKGQIHDQNYKARPDVLFGGSDGNLVFHLKKNGISYQLNRIDSWKEVEDKHSFISSKAENKKREIDKSTIYRLDINWLNTNANPTIIKGKTCNGYSNFYLENCPNGAINVQSFEDVTYQSIYKGIDLKWYQKEGHLKYDYVIDAGANYKQIQLEFNGATNLKLNLKGELVISTPLGDIIEQAPLVIQNQKILKAKWLVKNNVVCFDIENIDSNQSFVIDPIVRAWGTYYGDSGDDYYTLSSKTDNSGNVYIAGMTQINTGTIIATIGSYQSTYAGGVFDAFLTKFSTNGVRQWGTYYGGSDSDLGISCTIDSNGNIYLVGQAFSISAIATVGSHQTIGGGVFSDAFLVKFDSNGLRQWGTYYGGAATQDEGKSCCTDAMGNVYLIGNTDSNVGTVISTVGAHQLVYGGLTDAFIVKFNANGVRQWGTYYGGADVDRAEDCVTDSNGNVYMTGNTSSNSGTNIASISSHQPNYGGAISDAFLVKFNANGVRQWGTYYGGLDIDNVIGCSIDNNNNVYFSGYTATTVGNAIATAGSHQSIHAGSSWDAYLVKFNSNGIRQWGTYYGGIGDDISASCSNDIQGNVYISGITDSQTSNVITTSNSYQSAYGGGIYDAYIVKFNTNGIRQWGTYYGDIGSESVADCAVDINNNIYLLGNTSSNSGTIIASAGSHQPIYGGGNCDTYLAKFVDCTTQPSTPIGNNQIICANTSATLTAVSGTAFINWYVSSTSTNVLSTGLSFVTPTLSQGIYTYYAEAFTCLPSANRSAITITVLPSPTISVNSGAICSGNSFTIIPSGANNYSINGGSFIISPTVNSNYTITGTNTLNNCSNLAISSITVNALPTITALSSSSLICSGQSTSLTVNGVTTYTWSTTANSPVIVISPSVTTSYTVNGTDANGCSNLAVITQSVSSCTNLLEISTNQSHFIFVYPNPNNGVFTIETETDTSIEIIDVLGNLIQSKKINAGKNQINLSDKSAGVYFLKTPNQVVKKVVVN
jgi:hypothetical protein